VTPKPKATDKLKATAKGDAQAKRTGQSDAQAKVTPTKASQVKRGRKRSADRWRAPATPTTQEGAGDHVGVIIRSGFAQRAEPVAAFYLRPVATSRCVVAILIAGIA
jgi:hypothetical protein